MLVRLWAWFIEPFGVGAISVWHAAGLSLLIGWVADSSAYYANSADDRRSPAKKFTVSVGTALLAPLLAWGMGAVFHSWM